MKNNQTLIAAFVLLILALSYWFIGSGEVDTKSVNSDALKIDQVDVVRVAVKTPESNLNFMLTGAGWMLEDYPVDTLRMTPFLDQITVLKADRIISKNPEKFAKYEVDELGTLVSFYDANDDPLLELIIGKQGANYQETFVRQSEKDPIYAVLMNLSRYKDMQVADFWDKSITKIRVDEIVKVGFSGEHNFNLDRQGPVWNYNGTQVDFQKVQDMLRSLENLKASNFVDEISPEKAWYQTISILLESGESVELQFYLKDENASTLLLDASTKSKKFEYPKSGLNRFKKTMDDLKLEPVE